MTAASATAPAHAQSTAITPPPAPATAPPAEEATATTVVKVDRIVPRRSKVVRHRFQPWGRPSPRKVRRIIRIEARRWHISAAGLSRRVACESGYRWWAGNGAYQGLLQFAYSTFTRGLSTIRDRRVVLVRKRSRWVRERKVVHYSDGRVVNRRGRRHRQRVKHVYVGRLPRRPSVTHAWTQLRIGAQAIRGISAVNSSEWSCPA